MTSQQHLGRDSTQDAPQTPRGPTWLPTGVVGHQLLQAVELGAGGDVEAATVQLADLVVLHVEPLGIVKVGHREAIGTCGQTEGLWEMCRGWVFCGWLWGRQDWAWRCCLHPKAEDGEQLLAAPGAREEGRISPSYSHATASQPPAALCVHSSSASSTLRDVLTGGEQQAGGSC